MENKLTRVEVRKIYVGRSAIFGLYYGILMGVITSFFLFIFVFLGLGTFDVLGTEYTLLTLADVYVGSIFILIFFAIAGSIVMAVTSLFYNLFAKLKGSFHLGLLEINN